MNDWISVDVVCMLLNSMITEMEMQLHVEFESDENTEKCTKFA